MHSSGPADKAHPETVSRAHSRVYALERISLASERDHWMVMEVLCAYVRNWKTDPYEVSEGKTEDPADPALIEWARNSRFEWMRQAATALDAERDAERLRAAITLAATDVQAILDVLRRRKKQRETRGPQINLSGADLSGADLRGADLRKADLFDVDLRGADLRKADLFNVDLRGADLRLANLRGTNLYYADLRGAILNFANLSFTDLRGAKYGSVTQEQIDLAMGCANTQLPEGLTPPARWTFSANPGASIAQPT